jgi:hypothetical protein
MSAPKPSRDVVVASLSIVEGYLERLHTPFAAFDIEFFEAMVREQGIMPGTESVYEDRLGTLLQAIRAAKALDAAIVAMQEARARQVALDRAAGEPS